MSSTVTLVLLTTFAVHVRSQLIGANGQFFGTPFGPFGQFNQLSNSGSAQSLNTGDNQPKYCYEPFGGQRANQEVWITQNGRWQQTCKDGHIHVTGCVGGRRTNFQLIKLNQTLDSNGFWHKCEQTDANTVKYSQEASCLVMGKELHMNETFRNGVFDMRCNTWGYDIVGCYYYDATGKAQVLNVSQTVQVGILKHSCTNLDSNNTGRVKYSFEATACLSDNGTVYELNATWTKDYLQYQCFDKGQIKAIACRLANGTIFKVGENIIESKQQLINSCYRLGDTVYYHQYPCDLNTGVCTVRPIPTIVKTPTNNTVQFNIPAYNSSIKLIQTPGTGTVSEVPLPIGTNGVRLLPINALHKPHVLISQPTVLSGYRISGAQSNVRTIKYCTDATQPIMQGFIMG